MNRCLGVLTNCLTYLIELGGVGEEEALGCPWYAMLSENNSLVCQCFKSVHVSNGLPLQGVHGSIKLVCVTYSELKYDLRKINLQIYTTVVRK